MTTMQILYLIMGLSGAFLIYVQIKRCILYKSFQKHMKLNDPCFFYINSDRIAGNIKAINNETKIVVIEDCEGDLHHVIRFDVYPYWF